MLHVGGRRLPIVGRARLYVCGITPYDTTHLGHAATFVWADVAARELRHLGVDVEVCRNVTDVDDVLDEAAARSGSRSDSFAAVQQFRFDRDMTALAVRPPTHEPRARSHVSQVVTLAAALLAVDAAYERDGTGWFRGAGLAERAGLGEAAAAALAVEYGHDAEQPVDVPVWRRARAGEVAWPSPWGEGRPGWHAECAAMAMTTFGPSLDLHAGGTDLRFPHHAYESAMAEALTGVRPFSRAWLHVGMVRRDGEKMAKSTGNLVLVSDLVPDHPPAAVRLMLLTTHWRDEWDYTPDVLPEATALLDRLHTAAGRHSDSPTAEAAVTRALLNDLDVPTALGIAEEEGGRTARLTMRALAFT
jgi:cysteinyl-tRNA synthetase